MPTDEVAIANGDPLRIMPRQITTRSNIDRSVMILGYTRGKQFHVNHTDSRRNSLARIPTDQSVTKKVQPSQTIFSKKLFLSEVARIGARSNALVSRSADGADSRLINEGQVF